jgi:hypothetical protein
MVLPVAQFQPYKPLTLQSPLTTALNAGTQGYSDVLRSRFLSPQLQGQQTAQGLQNQLRQAQIPLAQAQVPFMEAKTDLLRKQLTAQPEIKWLSPAAKAQADIETAQKIYGKGSPQAQSLIDKIKAEAAYTKQRGDYYQALGESIPLRYTGTLNRKQIIDDLTGKGFTVAQASQMAAQLDKYRPIPGTEQTQIDPSTGYPMPTPLQRAQAAQTPQNLALANRQHEENRSNIQKDITIPDAQKRAYASRRFDIFADQAVRSLTQGGASEYFGLKGRAKLLADEGMAKLGWVDPKLQQYRLFKSQWDQMISEAAIMMAVPADVGSRKKLSDAFKLETFGNNPEAAIQMAQYLVDSGRRGALPNIDQLSTVKKELLKSAKEGGVTDFIGAPLLGQLQTIPSVSGGADLNSQQSAQEWLSSPSTTLAQKKAFLSQYGGQ